MIQIDRPSKREFIELPTSQVIPESTSPRGGRIISKISCPAPTATSDRRRSVLTRPLRTAVGAPLCSRDPPGQQERRAILRLSSSIFTADTEAQLQRFAASEGKNAARVVEETFTLMLERPPQFSGGGKARRLGRAASCAVSMAAKSLAKSTVVKNPWIGKNVKLQSW